MFSKTRTRLCISTALVSLAALPGMALAQESDDEGEFLGTLTLGTSKRAVQTDTAAAKTVIDQAEIDDRQANTVAELIDSVPGVSLVNGSTPTGSGLNIRGFGANGTFGTDQKVAIIIDGATTGGEELYRIGNQLFTDPYLYKSVEVVRGTVGSFEFGAGLVGGTVRLETRDASDFTGGEPGIAVGATAGYFTNNDAYNGSATLAWQPIEDLELLGNFSYREQGIQRDGNGDDIGNSAFELPSFLLKIRYSFGEAHSIMASFTQSSSNEQDVPYDTFITSADAFGRVNRDTKSQTFSSVYSYNPLDNDWINFEIALSYANQDIDGDYIEGSSPLESNPFFGPVVAALGNAQHQFETTRVTFRNEAYFQTAALQHRLRAGVEYIRRDRADAEAAPGGTDNRFAFFLIDVVEFGGGFELTPALRYETSNIDAEPFPGPAAGPPGTPPGPPVEVDVTNDAIMGGISLRYVFDNGLSFFGSLARTELLPIIDDAENALFIEQSEIGDTWEVGFAYNKVGILSDGDNFAFKLNYYNTKLKDVTSYSGIDQVNIEGVEIEASLAFEQGTYIDFNGAFTSADAIELLGDGSQGDTIDFNRAPVDNFRLTLGQRIGQIADLSYEAIFNLSDDRTGGGVFGSGDAFDLHNLRLTFVPQETFLAGTQFRIGIENVTDEQIQPLLSTRPLPGRNFKFTVTSMF
ncbi:MAG: TonB-dependent receptor [Pseudomonadota bacterium]